MHNFETMLKLHGITGSSRMKFALRPEVTWSMDELSQWDWQGLCSYSQLHSSSGAPFSVRHPPPQCLALNSLLCCQTRVGIRTGALKIFLTSVCARGSCTLSVCARVVHAPAHVREQLWESLPSYHVEPRGGAQVQFSSKCCYWLSQLISPWNWDTS